MNQRGKVLLMCYGNPGRLDDGLGPAFGEAAEKLLLTDVTVDIDYQLTVEDGALAAEYEVVVFVDAAVEGREPFFFKPLIPKSAVSFSSHSVEPENVLALAQELFGTEPRGYALGIRGYEFNEFGEDISPAAQANMSAALQFLVGIIKTRSFAEAAAKLDEADGDN